MTVDMVLGVVRHVFTFGGGLLAAKGYTDQSTVDVLVGALVTVVGSVWSIWQKYSASKA